MLCGMQASSLHLYCGSNAVRGRAGWRSALLALAAAAGDPAAPVVERALDGVQPVIEGLFREGGVGAEL